jgi:hypothetical protein
MKGSRGGARPGAGRKPTGHKTLNTMFSLSLETLALLGKIPRGARSKFVDAAIRAKLDNIKEK